jgi:hypothetical protein
VDWIVLHPIPLEGGTLDDLTEFVRSETQDLASTLPVLALALSEAANPRRVRALLENYPRWLRAVSDTARSYLLGILPNISAHLNEQESNVDLLIACLNACTSAEDCEILCECVGRYQDTSGSMILAAAEIAGVAIRTDSRPLVEKLMLVVAPEGVRESKVTRELLPALAGLKTIAGESAAGEKVWSAALGACVAVAVSNHAIALHLAGDLRGLLASMTAERQVFYLRSLQCIVEDGGISLLEYGTKQLPALFQELGDERATQFVAQGTAIARRYGKVAAAEFLEQGRGASRNALRLISSGHHRNIGGDGNGNTRHVRDGNSHSSRA